MYCWGCEESDTTEQLSLSSMFQRLCCFLGLVASLFFTTVTLNWCCYNIHFINKKAEVQRNRELAHSDTQPKWSRAQAETLWCASLNAHQIARISALFFFFVWWSGILKKIGISDQTTIQKGQSSYNRTSVYRLYSPKWHRFAKLLVILDYTVSWEEVPEYMNNMLKDSENYRQKFDTLLVFRYIQRNDRFYMQLVVSVI